MPDSETRSIKVLSLRKSISVPCGLDNPSGDFDKRRLDLTRVQPYIWINIEQTTLLCTISPKLRVISAKLPREDRWQHCVNKREIPDFSGKELVRRALARLRYAALQA